MALYDFSYRQQNSNIHIKMCFLFNSSTCYMFCVLCNKNIVRRQTDTWTTWTTFTMEYTLYIFSVCWMAHSMLYHVYAVCSRLHIHIYIASHSYPKEFSPLMPAILMNDWICTMHMSGQRNFIWLNIVHRSIFCILCSVVWKHFTFHQMQ